jgi:hypothetical protein
LLRGIDNNLGNPYGEKCYKWSVCLQMEVRYMFKTSIETSSLNNNRTLVRMMMKDLLTLRDVKEAETVRLQDMISLKMSWLILVKIMSTLQTKWSR